MMDREVSLSLDEAIETFDRISKPWMAVEESYDIDRENLSKFEQEIVLVERAVISENLFSENEEFEEVHEDYARGKVLFNSNTDRMKKLELASTFYKAYFDLCDHYGVLPIQLGTVMEQIKKGQYKADREVKIKMYKAQKVAEDEASSLESKYLQGSAKKRDYLRSLLMLKCFQALSDIEIIPQELEMLKFRQKLDTDDAFKQQYQAEMNKQRPKPYFYKLDDGSEGGNKAMQINSADVRRVGGTPATLGQYETKLDIKDKLWQPDFAQPKMTMDEHGELESRLMIEKAERDKENARLEKEKMDLLNEEEQHELENLKSRAWDDWKDLNEKGAGNKQR